MSKKHYTIDDFKIGEKVFPENLKALNLMVIGIDRKRGKIICQLTGGEKLVHEFSPESLEKDIQIKPGKLKNGNKETTEENWIVFLKPIRFVGFATLS